MSSEHDDDLGSEESDDTRATSNKNLPSRHDNEDASTDEELDSSKPYGDIQPFEKDDDESTVDPNERQQQRDARKKARQRATTRSSQEIASLEEELDADNLHVRTPIASYSDLDFQESFAIGEMGQTSQALVSTPVPPQMNAVTEESGEIVPYDQTTNPKTEGALVPMEPRAMIPIDSRALTFDETRAMIPIETGDMMPVDSGTMVPAPVETGALVPVDPGTMVPVETGALVPVDSGTMVPVETGALVPVDSGSMMPVETGALVPVDSGSMMPVETGALVPVDSGSMMPVETGALVPVDSGSMMPVETGALVPVDSGSMMPVETGALVPVDSGSMMPVETGALVTVDPGTKIPVQPGVPVPADAGTMISFQPGSLVSTGDDAIVKTEPEDSTSGEERSIVPLQHGTMVSTEVGAMVPIEHTESATMAPNDPVGAGAIVPIETRAMVAFETEAKTPVEAGAMVLYEGSAMVPVEADAEDDPDEAEDAVADDVGAMIPVKSGPHLAFESGIAYPTRNEGFPNVAPRTVVPLETRIGAYVPPAMDERALVVHESQLVPMDSDQESVHSKESKESSKSAMTSWSGYEEKSVSSGSQVLSEKPRHHDDDVSITPEDVFGLSRPMARIPAESPIPEDRTVKSEAASSNKNRSKAYSDDVSTVVEEEIIEDHFDDASTINTFGSSYWSSLDKPTAAAQSQIIPETIYEEDDEDEESQRDASVRSMQSSVKKPFKLSESASLNTSWRSASAQSATNSSAHSSSRDTTRGSSRDGMRMMQRPATGRAMRRDQSREVEVSLDGFLHQKRIVSSGGASVMHQPLLTVSTGEKPSKLSRMYQITTLCSLMCLMATVLFFAAHIGPFVIQPEQKGRPAASPASQGVSTQSAGLIADPSMQGESSAFLIAPNSTENPNSSNVPLWVARSFLNWKMPHKGGSSEVPFFWNNEKSGGEIAIESLGRCLGKVIAGQGKAYDENRHPGDFESDQFRVMISPSGLKYLNVDLFSLDGLDRAGSMGVTQNRVADMVDTPFLKLAAEKLFAPKSGEAYPEVPGRLFVMFRDPMDRALNRYEMTRILAGDDSLSLSAFATNPIYSENNPLARELLGIGPQDALGSKEMGMVHEILDQHVVVGLFHDFEHTMKRFEQFTHWSVRGNGGDNNQNDKNDELANCHKEVWSNLEGSFRINGDYASKDPVGFNLLAAGHTLDRLIFQHAKELYIEQGKALSRISSNTT